MTQPYILYAVREDEWREVALHEDGAVVMKVADKLNGLIETTYSLEKKAYDDFWSCHEGKCSLEEAEKQSGLMLREMVLAASFQTREEIKKIDAAFNRINTTYRVLQREILPRLKTEGELT